MYRVEAVPAAANGEIAVGRATLAGLCANLVGIGLARFAYAPLIPALIAAHWLLPAQAVYLGAANLAGYLAGALLAHRMAVRVPVAVVLRVMMLLATAAFFACALPLSFLWLSLWRFAAGVAGGALMVLAATTVLSHVSPSRRGIVGGIVFTGVGLGIAASGLLVPLLLRLGLAATWCGLGLLSLALTLVAWGGWLTDRSIVAVARAKSAPARPPSRRALKALYAEYALNAVGLVPHMVFLVDFVARGLGRGIASGAQDWVIYGIGAILGPVLAGRLADAIGFGTALRLAYVVQAIAVAALAATTGTAVLIVSSFVVGAFTPGIVPLVLGRVHELADASDHKIGWSIATTAFALGQAAAAYGCAALFAATGDYGLLFMLGSAALLLALAIDLVAARREPSAVAGPEDGLRL
ncbi:MAG TPA: YbfB/YjiJ family MFS transporter [Stellaceae bacterium]|jgi:predicted MFS family arabinose efflux permease|nr:YbfB/YjiJ family MFS transporter [Stellaceae bacterium]